MSLASRLTVWGLQRKTLTASGGRGGICVIRFNHLIQKSGAKEVNLGDNALPRQQANRGGKKSEKAS